MTATAQAVSAAVKGVTVVAGVIPVAVTMTDSFVGRFWDVLTSPHTAVDFVVAFAATMLGVYVAVGFQKQKEIKAAKQLAMLAVEKVAHRLSAWKGFADRIHDSNIGYRPHFEISDWSLLEITIEKIDLFSVEKVRFALANLSSDIKDMEFYGLTLLKARRDQLKKWNDGRAGVHDERFQFMFIGDTYADWNALKKCMSRIQERRSNP